MNSNETKLFSIEFVITTAIHVIFNLLIVGLFSLLSFLISDAVIFVISILKDDLPLWLEWLPCVSTIIGSLAGLAVIILLHLRSEKRSYENTSLIPR